MNNSFELLSSMSPKLKNKQKTLKQVKPITVLALKKYFRRSSVYDNIHSANDEPIIIEDSTESGSTVDSKQDEIIDSVIETTDSEESGTAAFKVKETIEINDNTTPKIDRVQKWLNDIKPLEINREETFFSQVSTIYGNEEKNSPDKHQVAASSTFCDRVTKRFDELFLKNRDTAKQVINETLLTSDSDRDSKMHGDKKECVPNDTDQNVEELKSMLDSLYGTKWREKQDYILPLSEPSNKVKSFTANKIVLPVTEKVKQVQKPQFNCNIKPKKLNFDKLTKPTPESPWIAKLKGICDPDSDSDSGGSLDNKENKPTKIVSKKQLFNESVEEISTDEEYDKEVTRLYEEQKKKSVKKRSYTFLESLSANIPINKCDMSARIFRTNFKSHKDKLVEKLFALYNENVFNKMLPNDMTIEWNNKLRNTAGLCYCVRTTHRNGQTERKARISLSTKIIDCPERLRDTLIHEMCHAATWIVNQISSGHGPLWKQWGFKAMKTFPELPPIKRCHSYSINTKYTYRCTGCGYSFGRHSKSLDTERKICAICHSKFEVFLNKTSKSGNVKTVLATPKKELNGFALFVKENYALYKEPTKKHADVMKILGQKFSQMKINLV